MLEMLVCPQPRDGWGTGEGEDPPPEEQAARRAAARSGAKRRIGRRTTDRGDRFPRFLPDGIISIMRRLVDAREHLDGALLDQRALLGNLRDLRRIKATLGGAELSLRAMREFFEPTQMFAAARPGASRVLDVGTGAADIPARMIRAGGPWQPVHVTAVDSRPEIIDAAHALDRSLAGQPNLSLAVADGRALPFPDRAFDIAHASLVLHHLERDDAIALLRELGRVARIGVVVNDLQRGWLGWLGAWLVLHALTRNRFTLHDGPLSVRRAYTRREARDLLAAAGLQPIREIVGLAGHRWAIAAVHR
jgi:SAM-dependent methyltransferase